jgi:hypothetical protein
MCAGLESIPAVARLILSRALEPVSPVGNRPKADVAPQADGAMMYSDRVSECSPMCLPTGPACGDLRSLNFEKDDIGVGADAIVK